MLLRITFKCGRSSVLKDRAKNGDLHFKSLHQRNLSIEEWKSGDLHEGRKKKFLGPLNINSYANKGKMQREIAPVTRHNK